MIPNGGSQISWLCPHLFVPMFAGAQTGSLDDAPMLVGGHPMAGLTDQHLYRPDLVVEPRFSSQAATVRNVRRQENVAYS
jgi:hypothetical protein